MSKIITMANSGRVVLPKTIREQLSLRGGARLQVSVVADKIELVPEANQEVRMVRRGKRWVLSGLPAFDAGPAMKAARDDRDARIARRLRKG